MPKFASRWLAAKWRFAPDDKPAPRLPQGIRIYAVGDIHGRADLLNALLERIDNHLAGSPVEHPTHVFLGDYIDRGPASCEVIGRLIERQRTHEIVCLKGNHEAFMLEFLADPGVLDDWRHSGGLPTLMSYGLVPPGRAEADGRRKLVAALKQALPETHRDFLAGLRTNFVCGDYFFVHAGVRPNVRLADQKEEDLLWIRDEFLTSRNDFGKIVVHGHTPVQEPDIRKNRINIDTGAFASGKLTCLVLEGEHLSFL